MKTNQSAMKRGQEQYGAGLAMAFMLVLFLVLMNGCTMYYVSITESEAGSVTPTITNMPSKTVDTSVGVSAARRKAAKGCTRCIGCQERFERRRR